MQEPTTTATATGRDSNETDDHDTILRNSLIAITETGAS